MDWIDPQILFVTAALVWVISMVGQLEEFGFESSDQDRDAELLICTLCLVAV